MPEVSGRRASATPSLIPRVRGETGGGWVLPIVGEQDRCGVLVPKPAQTLPALDHCIGTPQQPGKYRLLEARAHVCGVSYENHGLAGEPDQQGLVPASV